MEASTCAENAASCSSAVEASTRLQEACDVIQSNLVVVIDVKINVLFFFFSQYRQFLKKI